MVSITVLEHKRVTQTLFGAASRPQRMNCFRWRIICEDRYLTFFATSVTSVAGSAETLDSFQIERVLDCVQIASGEKAVPCDEMSSKRVHNQTQSREARLVA